MADDDNEYQRLIHEATLACGPNIGAIERYVLARTEAMSEERRAAIKRDIDRVLGFRSPPQKPYDLN